MQKFPSKCPGVTQCEPLWCLFISIHPIPPFFNHNYYFQCAATSAFLTAELRCNKSHFLCRYIVFLYIYFSPIPMNSNHNTKWLASYLKNTSLFWLGKKTSKDVVKTSCVTERQSMLPLTSTHYGAAQREDKTWHFISSSCICPASHSSTRHTELGRSTSMMKNSMTLIWHLQLLLLRLPLFFGLQIALGKQINQSGNTLWDVVLVAFFWRQLSRAALLTGAGKNSGISKKGWDESRLRSVCDPSTFLKSCSVSAGMTRVWRRNSSKHNLRFSPMCRLKNVNIRMFQFNGTKTECCTVKGTFFWRGGGVGFWEYQTLQ